MPVSGPVNRIKAEKEKKMRAEEIRQKVKMPAEYAPHERTLMAWPVKETMCHPENYKEFCGELAQAALQIARFEPVTMLVDESTEPEAKKALGDDIEQIVIPHNDCWLRDNGPTIVLTEDGQRLGVNWRFNAWGKKYPGYELDDQVAGRVLRYFGIPEIPVSIIMEGGSFHTDGEGTLLTTEECILNQNRNPHKTRREIEEIFRQHLGVEKMIFLPKGLFGDETDGHVDNVACFACPGTILLQVCDNPADPNFERSREHLRILENETDARGRRLKVIQIPQPPVMVYQHKRLTLSYLNFYMVNGGILLPVFGLETDEAAISILKEVFPDRTLVTVDGMKLVKEGGNVHCLTQQMPKGGDAR